MPSLSDTLVSPVPDNLQATAVQAPPVDQTTQPSVYNSFMRCPLPPIWESNPDSVRQFYTNGVPQIRVYAKSLVK